MKFRKVLALSALSAALIMGACGTKATSGPSKGDEPFYVYSWNTEVGDRLEYFKKAYPEYAERIVYVNTGGSETYQEKIDAILATPNAEEYPDLIALEADYIKKYVSSDYTLDVKELGIKEEDYKNQYQYTLDIPKDERTSGVKALSWQAAPGAMMYRRSLATKYLGSDDPKVVQEYFKDWDTMVKTGQLINEKSSGATKLFSGNDDVFRVYMAAREKAWVQDGKLVIDDVMLDYMDFNKVLEQENLTNKTEQWSEAWSANAANDNTFAYMGCTWFLHWTIKPNSGGTKVGEGTYGDWAMTQGPQEYYWGGTWLAATEKTSDKGLAGLIMKFMTCDTDNMYNIASDTLDYVNNKESVNKLIGESKGAFEFLGGQDFLNTFAPLAEGINVSTMTAYDQTVNTLFHDQVKEYSLGNKEKDQAIADFKAKVIDTYPTLKVE